MKFSKELSWVLFFFPFVANADCGPKPTPPSLLESPELSVEQRESVGDQLSDFFKQIEAYKKCIDLSISQLAPDDAPQEYFSSNEYQSNFEALRDISESTEQIMQLAVDRYSYLLEESK